MTNLRQLTILAMGIIIAALFVQNIKLNALVYNYQKDNARRTYVMAAYSVKNDTIKTDTAKINNLFSVKDGSDK